MVRLQKRDLKFRFPPEYSQNSSSCKNTLHCEKENLFWTVFPTSVCVFVLRKFSQGFCFLTYPATNAAKSGWTSVLFVFAAHPEPVVLVFGRVRFERVHLVFRDWSWSVYQTVVSTRHRGPTTHAGYAHKHFYGQTRPQRVCGTGFGFKDPVLSFTNEMPS